MKKIFSITICIMLAVILATPMSTAISEANTETATTLVSPEGWTCPKCGNQATGNFCNNCGTARPDSPESGTVIPSDTPEPAPTESSKTDNALPAGKTAHIESGKYVGGDDMPAGKYILTCRTDSKSSGIVWLAKDTDNLEKQYPSVLYEYIDRNEERRFYLNIGAGYVLYCPFACDLTLIEAITFEEGTAQIEAGQYIFGDDLPAGKYILVCEPGNKDSGIVWLAKDTDDLSNNYPSILYEFLGNNETKRYYVHTGDNYILDCPFPCKLIEFNTPDFENDSITIEPGIYVFGDDLPAGKYIITCNTTSQDSGIIWLATDTDDLKNNYPSLLYEFVGENDQEKFSINVKDGYILNCPFGCTITKSQGVNFN